MTEGVVRKATVIGNGRTLKDFDFKEIKEETIGLTMAIRHWYKIDWFPDYYVNVDHVVLKHHHKLIKKMIDEEKCKKGYLLSRAILQVEPELEKNEKVIFLEDLQRMRNNPFRYLLDWCSGSCAVLFAVILGFNDLQLIGFDCNYKEFLPETEMLPDGRLKITKTPDYNPNYFVDDYQQEGDLYNKPNMDTVHTPSWEHIVFIITGYIHMNRFPMMIHAFSDDEVVGLTKYFPKKHIKDYGCEEPDEKSSEDLDTVKEEVKEIYDPMK
jgi:hypothetical protein